MTDEANKSKVTYFDMKKIHECIPHRYPFLLVDKVADINCDEKTITGIKNVSINEAFFQGHFPSEPIMPGVLITEALAQAGGILIYEMGIRGLFVLSSIKNAKFRRLVRPGDVLSLEVHAIHASKRGGRMEGVAKVEGEMAAQAEILFAILSN